MPSSVKVITDSASDLPDGILSGNDIAMVSLAIRFGNRDYIDRVDLPTEEFWKMIRSSTELPQTAAPSPGAFGSAFDEAFEAGYAGVLCITMSASMSATYQSAISAAKEHPNGTNIMVVDSQLVSMAEGLLVMRAAEAAATGTSLPELYESISAARERFGLYGLIGSLDHLRRGGRIGGAQAFLGSMLSIKPIVEVREGRVEPESRQRTRGRAIEHMIAKTADHGPLARVVIVNGDSGDATVLEEKTSTLDCASETYSVILGAVVGTHTGPDTVAICFERAPLQSPVHTESW